MRFRDVDLRGIPVVTKSGEKIGKLVGFVVDAERHEIAQYAVAKSTLLSKILPDEFLIRPSQVISIDAEKMVVEDGVVAEKAAVAERAAGNAS